MQGLSQLQGLRRQFVPLKPLEGDKQEQLGDTFSIVIASNSKCNAVLKFKQSLPLQMGFSFYPSDKNDKIWLGFCILTMCILSAVSCEKLSYR